MNGNTYKIIKQRIMSYALVCTVLRSSYSWYLTSVAVSRLKDVPYFGPALPEKGKFKKNDAFREFLLTKGT